MNPSTLPLSNPSSLMGSEDSLAEDITPDGLPKVAALFVETNGSYFGLPGGSATRRAAATTFAFDICGPKVTHGRHCPCRACEIEDWPNVSAPCGMHGPDCPAVYDPIKADA